MALSSQPVSAFLPNKEKLYSEEVSKSKQQKIKSSSKRKKSSTQKEQPQQTVDTETLPSNARVVEVDGKQYVNIVTRKNEVKATYSADKWNKQVGYDVRTSNGGYSTSVKPSPSQKSYMEIGQEIEQKKQFATSIRQNSRQSSYVNPSVSENVYNRPTSYFQSIAEYNPKPVSTGQDGRTILSGGKQFYSEDFTARRPIASGTPVSYSDRTAIEIKQPVKKTEKNSIMSAFGRSVGINENSNAGLSAFSTIKNSSSELGEKYNSPAIAEGIVFAPVRIAKTVLIDSPIGASVIGYSLNPKNKVGFSELVSNPYAQTTAVTSASIAMFPFHGGRVVLGGVGTLFGLKSLPESKTPSEAVDSLLMIGTSAPMLPFKSVKTSFKKMFTTEVPIEWVTETKVAKGVKRYPTSKSTSDAVSKFRAVKEETFNVKSYKRNTEIKIISQNVELVSNKFIIDIPTNVKGYKKGGKYVGATASPKALVGDTVGIGNKGKLGLEDPGAYFAPGWTKTVPGRSSPYFTDIIGESYSRPKYTFNFVKPLIETFSGGSPTLTRMRFKEFATLPRSATRVPGFGGVVEYQKNTLGKGILTLTKRSEIAYGTVKRQKFKALQDYVDPWKKNYVKKGQMVWEKGTSETEAVSAPGERWKYITSKAKGLRGYVQRKLGYSEYTIYKGEFVGLPKANIFTKGKSAPVQKISKQLAEFKESKDFRRLQREYESLSEGSGSKSKSYSFAPSSLGSSGSRNSSLKDSFGGSYGGNGSSYKSFTPLKSFSAGSSYRSGKSVRSIFGGSYSGGGSSRRSIGGSSLGNGGDSYSQTSIFRNNAQTNKQFKIKLNSTISKRSSSISITNSNTNFKYTSTAYSASFGIKGRKIIGKLSGLEFRGVA